MLYVILFQCKRHKIKLKQADYITDLNHNNRKWVSLCSSSVTLYPRVSKAHSHYCNDYKSWILLLTKNASIKSNRKVVPVLINQNTMKIYGRVEV